MAGRKNTSKQKARGNGQVSKAKALQGRPDAEIECRSYTYHAFKNDGLFHWRDEDGSGIGRISHCTRGCGTSRYDYYNRNNVRVYRYYHYADGYQLEGVGKVLTADAIGELIRRADFIAPDIDSVNISGKSRLRAV